jgi:hypothetical protein
MRSGPARLNDRPDSAEHKQITFVLLLLIGQTARKSLLFEPSSPNRPIDIGLDRLGKVHYAGGLSQGLQ